MDDSLLEISREVPGTLARWFRIEVLRRIANATLFGRCVRYTIKISLLWISVGERRAAARKKTSIEKLDVILQITSWT